jgi:transcriptional regulator with XRE-family HTH domain
VTVENTSLTGGRSVTAVSAAVARQVKALRQTRAWSLDELAHRSGVSKGMVVQIESGRTNPSIGTLCRLAEAFGVDMGRLIETGSQPRVRIVDRVDAPVLWEGDHGGTARLLAGVNDPAFVEVWEWRFEPGDARVSDAHLPGTRELLWVRDDALVVTVDGVDHTLPGGSLIDFPGDRPHGYRNATSRAVDAILTVVMPPGEWDRRRAP